MGLVLIGLLAELKGEDLIRAMVVVRSLVKEKGELLFDSKSMLMVWKRVAVARRKTFHTDRWRPNQDLPRHDVNYWL